MNVILCAHILVQKEKEINEVKDKGQAEEDSNGKSKGRISRGDSLNEGKR